MLRDKIKHTAEQKYLEHKQKEQELPKKVHKALDEELRPLTLMNKSVKQLSGVKGIYVKEIFMLSNMFSWNTSNVFEIYEADAQGKLLHPDAAPILYAVAQLTECCSCDCATMGTSQIAITTRLDQKGSDAPYIFMKEKNVCCGFNTCEIFINEKGNGNLIGQIQEGCRHSLELSSDYVNKLSFAKPFCNCSWNQVKYDVKDANSNRGILNYKTNCCDCNNPYTYECGFPPQYNEDQNTLYLAGVIYLGYVNFQARNKSKNSSSSGSKRQNAQIEQIY